MNTNKEWRKPGQKRLAVDLENALWFKVRDRAQMANVSISKWVKRALLAAMKEEVK